MKNKKRPNNYRSQGKSGLLTLIFLFLISDYKLHHYQFSMIVERNLG